MYSFQAQLFLASLLPAIIEAQETVLGAFVFHRHGDRTTKAYTPVSLTPLGYDQVYASGSYYKSRYLSNTSASYIYGINSNTVKLSQLTVEAPVDNTLQNSAQGWLQGLYPPYATSQTLANGTIASAPLGGYQLIPVNVVASSSTAATSENSGWLQGSSGCTNAITSSNNYFSSNDYLTTASTTKDFYANVLPAINTTFNAATSTFKNAYTIYDYVHVSEIHNSTWPSKDVLTNDVLFQLQTRADQHEFGLAYNSSEPIRAIAGSTLAAQIVQNLNSTIMTKSASKLNVQFGAYASFLSFFGLAQLPTTSVNFTGIVDYASSMTFELVTNATVSASSYPTVDQISVRFLFSNGSAAQTGLSEYPLFGQSATVIPWTTFTSAMNKFAIGDQTSWCQQCGVTTGSCAATSTTSSSGASATSTTAGDSNSGISNVVAGVIGAMVTLAVILGLEALFLLIGGFRLASKKRLAQPTLETVNVNGKA